MMDIYDQFIRSVDEKWRPVVNHLGRKGNIAIHGSMTNEVIVEDAFASLLQFFPGQITIYIHPYIRRGEFIVVDENNHPLLDTRSRNVQR